ncbi:hypothetical protein MNAN1_001080 [Malassezia nana]|uniref:Uncharacterized protein n=1 Tax=Malassezia nana TaxID=180528 RepID=A0AAF0EK92_9BASI|nr:hypothetical protein MNAN1_001080 [Malassezia nana]
MSDIAPTGPRAFLTLIRHAESQANVDRVLQGVTDAPLSSRGEEQLRKLEAGWRLDNQRRTSAYALPKPTLIVTSPLGRARKTSNAVARGCGIREVLLSDATTFRSPACRPPAPQAHPSVLVDAGLSERNFGAAECTRKSELVAGYERPPRAEIGRAESHSQFEKRVRGTGLKWIEWLRHHAASTNATTEAVIPTHEPEIKSSDDHRKDTDAPSATEPEVAKRDDPQNYTLARASVDAHAANAVGEIPHLVLVSHGQWINAFLSHHFPEMRQGQDAYYIRSLNTALFTMELVENGAQSLRLVRKNDTSHLGPDAPRPTKRRAVQSTRLTDMWHAAPSASSFSK